MRNVFTALFEQSLRREHGTVAWPTNAARLQRANRPAAQQRAPACQTTARNCVNGTMPQRVALRISWHPRARRNN
eukprot:10669344-Lingulodinium_polyedra.AAC.1